MNLDRAESSGGISVSTPATFPSCQRPPRVLMSAVMTLLGLCLIGAAGLKGHQLAYHGVPAAGLVTSAGGYALVALSEFLLGMWLVSGLVHRKARLVALVYFWVFLEAALWLALTGAETCGCLGQIAMNPWAMVAIDLSVLTGLILIPADGCEATVRAHSMRSVGFALLTVGVVVPGLLTMTVYRRELPKTLVNELRQDRRLHETRLVIAKERPSANDLLNLLASRLGTAVQVESGIREEFGACDPQWKAVNRSVRGWAVLESVAKGMPVRSRWVTTPEGYMLIEDDPVQRARSYWMAGLLLVGLGVFGIAKGRPTTRVHLC